MPNPWSYVGDRLVPASETLDMSISTPISVQIPIHGPIQDFVQQVTVETWPKPKCIIQNIKRLQSWPYNNFMLCQKLKMYWNLKLDSIYIYKTLKGEKKKGTWVFYVFSRISFFSKQECKCWGETNQHQCRSNISTNM